MIIVLNKVLIQKQTHFCTIYNNNNKIIQLKHSKDIKLLCYYTFMLLLFLFYKKLSFWVSSQFLTDLL